MNTKRLGYLLETVIDHVEGMEVIDDYRNEFGDRKDDDVIGGCALLNFNWFVERNRATGVAISKDYDCGMEACLAGWYKLLAQQDGLIDDDDPDLYDFDFIGLAAHFGISDDDSKALFETAGRGAEDMDTRGTARILAARKQHLEGMLDLAA